MSLALHRYAIVTAAATFLLIVAGSLVTSTGSGLAVPDWPLSYGTWFPPMEGGIFYEHGHRMIAGMVGLMILSLAVWIARSRQPAWLARLGWLAAGAVVVQALLGGATVLLQLPPQISIAHAVLGQGVFCLTALLATVTAPSWRTEVGAVSPKVARLAWFVGAFTVTQIARGAVVRHTGYGVHAHIAVGLLVALHAALLARRARAEAAPVSGMAAGLLSGVAVQIALGFVLWTHRGWLWLRTVHVAMGALLFAHTALLIWMASRGAAFAARSRPGTPVSHAAS
jgi:cytochrome c oxidase assembly protein subunit 15